MASNRTNLLRDSFEAPQTFQDLHDATRAYLNRWFMARQYTQLVWLGFTRVYFGEQTLFSERMGPGWNMQLFIGTSKPIKGDAMNGLGYAGFHTGTGGNANQDPGMDQDIDVNECMTRFPDLQTYAWNAIVLMKDYPEIEMGWVLGLESRHDPKEQEYYNIWSSYKDGYNYPRLNSTYEEKDPSHVITY